MPKTLVLLTITSIVFMIFFVRYELLRLFLLFFTGSIYSIAARYWDVPLGFTEFNVIVFLLVIGYLIQKTNVRIVIHMPAGDKVFKLLVFFYLISSFFSVINRYHSTDDNFFSRPDIFTSYFAKPIIVFMMYYIGLYYSQKPKSHPNTVYALFFVFAALLVSVIPDMLRFGAFGTQVGLLDSRNGVGGFLAAYCILCTLVTGNVFKNKNISIVFFVCVSVIILLSLSRGAYVGYLFALLTYILFTRKFKLLPVLIIVLGLLVLFPPEPVAERVSQGFTGDSDNPDKLEVISSGRTLFWRGAWDYLREDPLRLVFGGGRQGYRLQSSLYTGRAHDYVAHNMFISVACDQGLVGLAIVIAIFTRMFYVVIRTQPVTDFGYQVRTGLIITIVASVILLFFGSQGDHFLSRQRCILLFFYGMLNGFSFPSPKRLRL